MAMALLGLFFLILTVLSVISIFLLFYNDGHIVKSKSSIVAITFFSIFLAYISATALPSNYTLQIALRVIVGIIGLVGGIIALSKENKFSQARMLLVIAILGNLFMIYF